MVDNEVNKGARHLIRAFPLIDAMGFYQSIPSCG